MRFICTIFFLFLYTFTYARKQGQERLDSLLHELPAAKEDTKKVRLLNLIAYDIQYADPQRGMSYGKMALALTTRLNWKPGEAYSYNSLSVNSAAMSDYRGAISYSLKALEINEAIGAKRLAGNNLGNIAVNYMSMGDLAKSLEYFFKALKIAEELKDEQTIGLTLLGIGQIYINYGKYDKSVDCLAGALKRFRKVNDLANVAICIHTISLDMKLLHHYDSALVYNRQARELFDLLGNKSGIIVCVYQGASIATEMKNYSLCLLLCYEGLALSRKGDSKENIAVGQSLLGINYVFMARDSGRHGHFDLTRNQMLDSAIYCFSECVAINREINGAEALVENYKALAEAQAERGKYREAFLSYQQYATAKDSVFSTNNKVKMAELSAQRESELKEKQIAINKLSSANRLKERVIFGVGIMMLALITGLGVRTNRLQKGALQQKEMLMKEIHHRVKNNLQVISTLLDLQISNTKDEDARTAMTESTSRVRSISLIHQHLYREDHIATIEFSKFANDLHLQVGAVFSTAGQKVRLNNNIPEMILDIDNAVPLGLILNELLTNSYKYAFGGKDGTIDLGLYKNGEEYRMTYKDSGPGMAEGMDMSRSGGLGMRVMRSLSRQIDGSIKYEKDSKQFVVNFKSVAGSKQTD